MRYELKVDANDPNVEAELNRQVIRSDIAVIKIVEMDFEIPARKNGRGEISTVEGIVRMAADSLDATYLQSDNPLPEEHLERISDLVDWFRDAYAGHESFTFILEDPTGNSFIQNPRAPQRDLICTKTHFARTEAQTKELGFQVEEKKAIHTDGGSAALVKVTDPTVATRLDTYFDVDKKSAILPGECHNCGKQCETRMCITNIPKFKEVIIMVTECIHCGFSDSEVKPSGAISEFGTRNTLRVTEIEDLKREVLKSDSAGVRIPELDLELMPGTLGGKYTTVEGLLGDIKKQLETINTFHLGDSATQAQSSRMQTFMKQFSDCMTVSSPFTLVIEDPMGNCYIGSQEAEFNLDGKEIDDPALTIETFERTAEMNDDFGLSDMKVDNYASAEDLAVPDRKVNEATGEMEDAEEEEEEEDEEEDDEEDDEEEEDEDDMPSLITATGTTVNSLASAEHKADMNSFVASNAFDGARPGYVFQAGKQGLGYYRDHTQAISIEKSAQSNSTKQQEEEEEEENDMPALITTDTVADDDDMPPLIFS